MSQQPTSEPTKEQAELLKGMLSAFQMLGPVQTLIWVSDYFTGVARAAVESGHECDQAPVLALADGARQLALRGGWPEGRRTKWSTIRDGLLDLLDAMISETSGMDPGECGLAISICGALLVDAKRRGVSDEMLMILRARYFPQLAAWFKQMVASAKDPQFDPESIGPHTIESMLGIVDQLTQQPAQQFSETVVQGIRKVDQSIRKDPSAP